MPEQQIMSNFPLLVPADFTGALNVRYDEGEGAIPLSVADMDFQAPTQVVGAVVARAAQGAYGYTYVPQTLVSAVANWFETRHGWSMNPDAVIATGRVVEAIPTLLALLTNPADPVVVPSPSYHPITAAVEANGRRLVTAPMTRADGCYVLDLDAVREGLTQPTSSRPLLILTNPHNPTGRVFAKSELRELAGVAEECGALIISDDVHADILYPEHKYTPICTVSEYAEENTITFLSPGKTFNLAGLESTIVLVDNKELFVKVETALRAAGFHNPAYFAVVATQAAYEHGAPWLDQFLSLIDQNLQTMLAFIEAQDLNIKVIKPEGTYLVWMDLGQIGDEKTVQAALKDAGLVLSPGSGFGAGNERFARMNLATTPDNFNKALTRLALACKTAQKNPSK